MIATGAVAPILINHAGADDRYASHPGRKLYGIESYIAVPLHRRDGSHFGTLCALDPSPTDLPEDSCEVLELLASLIGFELETEEADSRQRFLADLSGQLAASLDYEATLHDLARLIVPSLASSCVVDAVEPDESLHTRAVAHEDPARVEILDELARRSPFMSSHPLAVDTSARAERYAEVTDAQLVHFASEPTDLERLRSLGIRSAMVVPLIARARRLGTIVFLSDTPQRYREADLTFAQEIAQRAALAIDNAWQYRQTQRAVRVRDDFLATTSHELRTPLSHIKGFVSTLRMNDVEWDEETRAEFLAEIEHESDRLSSLIGDLLDMSRIESGALGSADRAPTTMAALVERGLSRVRGSIGTQRLVLDVPDDLPLVSVSPSRVEHVVANLLENAAKFSPKDGVIRVCAATVHGDLELRVEDEGPGIPPEHLERVFDKFFRGRSTEQSGIPGTGLGLAICRGLIRAEGGRIWAETRDEGGARFTIALPIAGARVGGTA